MAKSKSGAQRKATSSLQPKGEIIRPEEKIARMLGILAVQSVKGRQEQASMLRAGGFTHLEIADMLDTTENGVSVLLYQAKKKKGKKVNGPDQP